MKIMKRISNDMMGNIDEAREKIRTAYELKSEYPEAASWYREMAAAHINFNSSGHGVLEKLIEQYKSSDAYKRNPEYANGMMGAWQAMHTDMMARAAEVKAMIDGFK